MPVPAQARELERERDPHPKLEVAVPSKTVAAEPERFALRPATRKRGVLVVGSWVMAPEPEPGLEPVLGGVA